MNKTTTQGYVKEKFTDHYSGNKQARRRNAIHIYIHIYTYISYQILYTFIMKKKRKNKTKQKIIIY